MFGFGAEIKEPCDEYLASTHRPRFVKQAKESIVEEVKKKAQAKEI
jgi:hypothetical protein